MTYVRHKIRKMSMNEGKSRMLLGHSVHNTSEGTISTLLTPSVSNSFNRVSRVDHLLPQTSSLNRLRPWSRYGVNL